LLSRELVWFWGAFPPMCCPQSLIVGRRMMGRWSINGRDARGVLKNGRSDKWRRARSWVLKPATRWHAIG
jgi:hypothetical protein